MKKKIFLIFALLAISTACFAGCTDNGTSKRIQKHENVTEIVAVDDVEKPAEETDDKNQKDEKDDEKSPSECPDGKCRREGMPRPRHRFLRPRPTKNSEN